MRDWVDPYHGECRYDDVNHCPDCGEAYDWHEGPTARRNAAERSEYQQALLDAIPEDPRDMAEDCYSCGHDLIMSKDHDPDCAWVKARKLMGDPLP